MLPPEVVIVSHAASSVTVHVVFEVIVNDVLPAVGTAFWFPGETVNVLTPSWVTVTICEFTPDPETVTVATLELVEVFASYPAVIVPLLLPPEAVIVSHAASSVIAQVVLDVIVNDVLPAAGPAFWLPGATDNVLVTV